ncbi:unnamed protein product [Lupinus luteus]|uniref:Uncharacterized protein n=1 Tax=Lupinus luteus TaxID=3873 RepID=A0AAV1WWE1_LUPLU
MANFITRTPFHQVTGIQAMNHRGGTIIDDVYVFDSLHINQSNNNGGVSRVMNTIPYPYMNHNNYNNSRNIRVNPASKHSIENLERVNTR